jgi:hypothetical protein
MGKEERLKNCVMGVNAIKQDVDSIKKKVAVKNARGSITTKVTRDEIKKYVDGYYVPQGERYWTLSALADKVTTSPFKDYKGNLVEDICKVAVREGVLK